MMSKYYSPRDWDVIGFGGCRRFVEISDEEKRKRANKKKKHNKKQKMKHANEDFWKVWENENENK